MWNPITSHGGLRNVITLSDGGAVQKRALSGETGHAVATGRG